MRRAVIIGAGMAGLLAARAAAASGAVDEVVIIEPDDLADDTPARTGLPQARHTHILMAGGAEAADELLPGIIRRWLDAGAHRQELTSHMVALSPEGWYRRWKPTGHYLITASRPLLDRVVREQVLTDSRIRLLTGRKVTALLGSSHHVTGVVHSAARARGDEPHHLHAALVVDASGRASRATTWLADLGVTGIAQRQLDTGLTYASRTFRAPAGARHVPVFNVMADPLAGNGRSAVVTPIENGQWIASLCGIKGSEPTRDPADFVPFALGLRHPLIGQLLQDLEPLSDVTVSRNTGNRRRYFEKVSNWPERFVALGDAIATFTPVYGQGLSVAALGALALHRELHRHGSTAAGVARRVQRAAAVSVDAAWILATAQDIHYTAAHGQKPTRQERLQSAFTSRLSRVATGSAFMADALTDVTSMRRPATRLLSPAVLYAAAAGPLLKPLQGPQLTPAERRLLGPRNAATPAASS
ncbi:FAD-dependent oxidoreductase [Streptomyces tauricus]|uniref:FAD-dependent oxidoreductase n=1 Tax=Streptomyces tauricus TaxID=68274 RepID=A0ABZ1JT76_9ACTN|nr:FAD-dependent oxidoreductase [Streptomyces tauricus]MCW8102233.1 FAD-dependent oxidoreductase [Streptomyces tauricus]